MTEIKNEREKYKYVIPETEIRLRKQYWNAVFEKEADKMQQNPLERKKDLCVAEAVKIHGNCVDSNCHSNDFVACWYARNLIAEVQAREKVEAHLQLQMKIDEQHIYTYRQGLIAAEIERDSLRQQLANREAKIKEQAFWLADARKYTKAAQAELALARERLGPAGYKMLEKIKKLEAIIEGNHREWVFIDDFMLLKSNTHIPKEMRRLCLEALTTEQEVK